MWVLVSVIKNCVTSLGNDLLWADGGLKVGIIFGIRNQLNCIHKDESKRDVQLHAMVKETQTRVSLLPTLVKNLTGSFKILKDPRGSSKILKN